MAASTPTVLFNTLPHPSVRSLIRFFFLWPDFLPFLSSLADSAEEPSAVFPLARKTARIRTESSTLPR